MPGGTSNQGYTGFGGIPGYILVSLWPDDANLPKLSACVVHEFNHQVRNTVEPWRMDISVAEYIIMEGLAESFASELCGPDAIGPWVTEVTPEALRTAREVVGNALETCGFNEVRAYIFGDEVMAAFGGGKAAGVPKYAGYAVGFHLVQAYLRKTGKTAAEATLVPSAEIGRVGNSGVLPIVHHDKNVFYMEGIIVRAAPALALLVSLLLLAGCGAKTPTATPPAAARRKRWPTATSRRSSPA